jgi:hypothetical protein
MPSPLPLPSRNADVSGLLEFATRLFKHSLSSCLPLAIAAVLASEAAELYWVASGHKVDATLTRDSTYWVLAMVGLLLSLWLSGALLLRQRALCAGKAGTIRADLASAGQRWPTLVIATLLAALFTAVGALLILPGIYFGFCMSLLLAVVMIEPLAYLQSIKRSYQLVRPMWIKVFASWVIAILIILVILFTLLLVATLIITATVGTGRAASAFNTTLLLAALAAVQVFVCALSFSLYSAASSSA